MSKERLTIKATPQGLNKARKAMLRMGYGSKTIFAQCIGLGRTTVTKFFQQQSIEYDSFKKICDNLELNLKDIAELSDLVELADDKPKEQAFQEQGLSTNIDVLVQDIREKIRDTIKKRCGTMRVLDMTQPIGVNDIYTDVNILEKITGRRRIELAGLVQVFDPSSGNFDRYGMGQVTEKRVPGIKAVKRHSKLMILGKPGAGKTTFLKYLAIQCIGGDFQNNRVPIFITLKQFAEYVDQPDILKFISVFLAEEGVTKEQISQLLYSGRLLFLLDGLDEVREEDSERVIKQISDFAERFSYSYFLKEDSDEITKSILGKFNELFINLSIKYLNNINSIGRGSILNRIRNLFVESLNKIDDNSIKLLFDHIERSTVDELKDSELTEYFNKLKNLLLEQFQKLHRNEYLKWLESEKFREKSKIIKYIKTFIANHVNEERSNLIILFSQSLQKFFKKELEKDALSFKSLLLSRFHSDDAFINDYLKWIAITFPTNCRITKNIRKLFQEQSQEKYVFELLQSLSNFLKKSPPEDYIELLHYQFPEKCYTNCFVITCRIAAREEKFEKFVEVEVADFNDEQIETFVYKWFQDKEPSPSQIFIQQLKLAPPIKELATNPLLLTLLCLVFPAAAKFPSNRSELYKEGVAILLKKWDGERLIKRNQIYEKLSPPRKEDLLSQIAFTTFERKDYFFRQTEVEQYIANYIRNLPDAQTDPKALRLDSELVLKSIEAQHGLLVERARGIYSFSHLTFQEYFTARKIVTNSDPQTLEQALQNLATHITEVRWREVFLLALGNMPSADRLLLLMKQQVDMLIARSHNLQQLLKSVMQRALLIQNSYEPVVMRAFFFANELTLDHELSFILCKEFQLSEDLNIDSVLNHVLNRALDGTLNRVLLTKKIDIELDLSLSLNRALNLNLEPNLKQTLQKLKDQMPDKTDAKDTWNQWWKTKGSAWAAQLKAVMNQYSIGQNWQFSDQQKQALKQYYNANLFLVECLNSDCYVSLEVRKRIQDTLLLPMVEIKKYK